MADESSNPGAKDLNQSSTSTYNDFPVTGLKPGTQYSFQFQWAFEDGTESEWSPGFKVTTTTYTTKLVAPTITVTATSLGYNVAYTKQTDKNFLYIIIEEVISNASTAPSTGWSEVSVSSSNPVEVKTGDINKRWVRAKLSDKIYGSTAYSTPVSVTPVDPVAAALDTSPPATATGISASWSGDDVLITATVAADSKKFIISLTNGSDTRVFTKFPATTGTSQSIKILDADIYGAFGRYPTSFTGTLISADSFDNRDNGGSFSVPQKANALLGVVPTFVLTPITNGYTATWVLPSGASYAKVYESGTTWGAGNPTESDLVFSGASPAIIKKTTYTQRYVKILYLTKDGSVSSWSAEQTVTPVDAIAADTVAPSSPSSITGTTGVDSTGSIGFNGYINLTWTAVSDSSLRGYRIRFRPYKATTPLENYSYVDSPGTGTSYRLGGLAVGTTYEVAIASYDEFNNTSSSYTSVSPNPVVSGTPFIGTNVTTTGYFGASSGGDTGEFRFGYGVASGKRGITFNDNNYWYIDSGQSASFKIGGSSSNYVSWNGSTLSIDGNLGVAGGTTIGGNIAMGQSGASIYQGTLSGGNLSSDGFLLNSGGLVIKKGAVQLRLDTSDGGIYADYGRIAGWTLDSSKLERLNSGTYSGISSTGTYAFYAGGSSGGSGTPPFKVTQAGQLTASSVEIKGGTLDVGGSWPSGFHVDSSGNLKAANAILNGEINATTGTIGNVKINSGGLYISDGTATSGNRVIFDSAGVAAYANGVTDPKFLLSADGTAKVGGWTAGTTTLTSIAGNMVLNASDQTISFKQGFIIDNNTTNVDIPSISTVYNPGSSGSGNDSDTPQAYYSSITGTSSGSFDKSLSIRLPGSPTTNSPRFVLTADPIAGSSILLQNYGNAASSTSSIQLAKGGIVITTTPNENAGGLIIKGLLNSQTTHYTYGRQSWYYSTGSYPTGALSVPGMLMIDENGNVSAGRAIYKTGATEANITNINHAVWPYVGLVGDLMFSTAD